VDSVLKAAGDWRAALAVAAFGGLRRAEITNLRAEDIDRGRRLIHVVNRPPAFTVKTYQARSVPVGLRLLRELPKDAERVCPSESLNALTKAARETFKAAGVAGSLHALRHNYVTYLLLAGVPVAEVMARVGHRNLGTTEGYTHVRQAVEKRDVAAFKRAMGIS